MRLTEFLGFSTRRNGGREAPGQRDRARTVSNLMSACHDLLSERGELSATRTAGEILAAYEALDQPGRELFFDGLAKEFSPDPETVGRAGDAYRDNPSPENLARLQRAVESPRQELFRGLNVAPGGTRVLVEMRGHLLREKGDTARAPIAADLKHLLTSWFNRGFLVLQKIDWRTSATILEKLIKYEAVHQIQGFPDLRRRLAADRRCYAFFHPAMPEEPIIFVEAALTEGMSASVQPLLDPESPEVSPESADCAIFYSITNCQEGLRGVPMGSFLIKQVVEALGTEFPRVRRYATLSPVSGFCDWLRDPGNELVSAAVVSHLEDPSWIQDSRLRDRMREYLVPLCSYYLLKVKRGKEPLDNVARFHLRNGARLDRINWLGDTSKTGLTRSAGITVNYLYRLSDLERNHELYTRDYRVAASRDVEALRKHLAERPAKVVKAS